MKKWLYLFFITSLLLSLFLIRSIYKAYKEKIEINHKATIEKPSLRELNNSFVINSGNRVIYTVILEDNEIQTENKKLSFKAKKKILKMVKRYGLKNVLCYKIAGRRFSCIFSTATHKEALLKLKCDVFIVAQKKEKILYPLNIMNIPNTWQKSWNNFRDINTLEKLYHPSLHRELEQRLKQVKYVDVVISNPSFFKLPASDIYVIMFKGIFRTNLTRKEGNFVLLVNNGKIIKEIKP